MSLIFYEDVEARIDSGKGLVHVLRESIKAAGVYYCLIPNLPFDVEPAEVLYTKWICAMKPEKWLAAFDQLESCWRELYFRIEEIAERAISN